MKSNVKLSVKSYWIKGSIASLLCILFLSLPGCEEKQTPEEVLIGTWNIESVRTTEYHNETKIFDATQNYNPDEFAIQFLKNGIGKVYKDGAVVDSYAWSFNADYGYLRSEDTFPWLITEDILIMELKSDIGQNVSLSVFFKVDKNDLILEFTSYDGIGINEVFLDGGCYISNYHIRVESFFILSR